MQIILCIMVIIFSCIRLGRDLNYTGRDGPIFSPVADVMVVCLAVMLVTGLVE